MRRAIAMVAVCTLLLVACGGGEEQEPSAGGGGGQGETQEETAQATIEAASTDLGEILVDPEGNTLYMFVPDQQKNGKPTCYDDCASAWPPLEASGEPTAGDGADQSLLDTARRTDGTSQVTYGGLPLYLFSGDEAAGDTNGQGLDKVWWVVSADGKPVKKK
jgi:predicted lipoprotein with Yx(FWY)xxD motif